MFQQEVEHLFGRFRDYRTGAEYCTCAVLFSTKKSKLEEEYKRLRKRYQEDGGIVLKDLAAGQFKFQAPSYIPAGAEEEAPEETEQKSDNPGKEE